jgi:hypothetical protein
MRAEIFLLFFQLGHRALRACLYLHDSRTVDPDRRETGVVLNSLSEAQIELDLIAPPRFDAGIGYWTGELDLELVSQLLAQLPPTADVRRILTATGVRLIGRAAAVSEEAESLCKRGMLPTR